MGKAHLSTTGLPKLNVVGSAVMMVLMRSAGNDLRHAIREGPGAWVQFVWFTKVSNGV